MHENPPKEGRRLQAEWEGDINPQTFPLLPRRPCCRFAGNDGRFENVVSLKNSHTLVHENPPEDGRRLQAVRGGEIYPQTCPLFPGMSWLRFAHRPAHVLRFVLFVRTPLPHMKLPPPGLAVPASPPLNYKSPSFSPSVPPLSSPRRRRADRSRACPRSRAQHRPPRPAAAIVGGARPLLCSDW